MAAHTTFLLLTLLGVTLCTGEQYPGCELLTHSTYCSQDPKHHFVPYSQYVGMPNIMGDESQQEAGSNVDQISQFVASLGGSANLDPNFRLFTCSMFLPPCMEDGTRVQPCRSLCNKARDAGRVMEQNGHRWPNEFRCDKFPDVSDTRISCIPHAGHSGGPITGRGPAGTNPSGPNTGGGGDTWVDEEEEWVDEEDEEAWEKADKGQGPVITPTKVGEGDEWVDEDEIAWEKAHKGQGPMVPASQCLDITREFSLNKCTCTCPP